MGPTKLLSVYGPWPRFIAFYSKRRENRDWQHPPSYRGEVWIHAALKSEPDLADLIATVAKTVSLHGKKPPTVEEIEADAGHILASARLVRVERNTPAVCLADRWAVPGQLGFVLEDVRPCDTPIPWKGAQGLADVDPLGVELVRIIAKHGHRLDLGAVPHTMAHALVHFLGAKGTGLADVIAALVQAKQLRRENDVLFTRAYKVPSGAGPDAPTPPAAHPNQISFGW